LNLIFNRDPRRRKWKTGNLWQSLKTNETIHFYPKKPRPTRKSPGGTAPLWKCIGGRIWAFADLVVNLLIIILYSLTDKFRIMKQRGVSINLR
ncbi:MAG: hypothetical protein D6714_01900, partial [Bacteroidetes bacterium]